MTPKGSSFPPETLKVLDSVWVILVGLMKRERLHCLGSFIKVFFFFFFISSYFRLNSLSCIVSVLRDKLCLLELRTAVFSSLRLWSESQHSHTAVHFALYSSRPTYWQRAISKPIIHLFPMKLSRVFSVEDFGQSLLSLCIRR